MFDSTDFARDCDSDIERSIETLCRQLDTKIRWGRDHDGCDRLIMQIAQLRASLNPTIQIKS